MKFNSRPGFAISVLAAGVLCTLLGSMPASAQSNPLAPGVRGVATRAPKNMKIDGDLSEFKDAFCTPVEYAHADLRNRAAQFFYLWDEEAFYAGLRTLDAKPAPTIPRRGISSAYPAKPTTNPTADAPALTWKRPVPAK